MPDEQGLSVGQVYRFYLTPGPTADGDSERLDARVVALDYHGAVRVVEGKYDRRAKLFSSYGINRYIAPERILSTKALEEVRRAA